MSQDGHDVAYEQLAAELERYKALCRTLQDENAKLKEELESLRTTVHAVVARSIDAKADTRGRRYKKSGRREGHRGEARIDALIQEYSASREKNCLRLLKRLRREKGMLFTFLEEVGIDWNNNAAERALRSSVVIRKITYGNQSDEGAAAHAVLMSIRETCNLRKENFFDYVTGVPGRADFITVTLYEYSIS